MWWLSVVAFGFYAIFLLAQMWLYRNLYTERENLVIAVEGGGETLESEGCSLPLWKAAVLLVAGLLVFWLIAESMGQLIKTGITDLGLPSSLSWVLVAMLILAPDRVNPV